jgi:hypothetical protein
VVTPHEAPFGTSFPFNENKPANQQPTTPPKLQV